MDKIFQEINIQIYETIKLAKTYFKSLEFSSIFLTIAFLYILFMRKWRLKKICSFFFISGLLFILFVRLDALLNSFINPQEEYFLVGLGHTFFYITLAVVFIYYAAVKEE